jgi:hypothetical protein
MQWQWRWEAARGCFCAPLAGGGVGVMGRHFLAPDCAGTCTVGVTVVVWAPWRLMSSRAAHVNALRHGPGVCLGSEVVVTVAFTHDDSSHFSC